ncbi:MAG: MFS transporter [Alphaproteobacteria bacterium]|nr:MFS transporter [Alphaproteobacteria bacterium]
MSSSSPAAPRLHYAWVVAAIAFFLLLVAAGVRAASGVLILPLEKEFGWSRASISAAAALSIFLYGFTGPFAAALTQNYGIRRVLFGAMVLLASATFASLFMTQWWQLMLTWGVMVGMGAGTAALPLGTAIVNRWFIAHRGLVIGILTASMAAGQLVFLPSLAYLAETGGWHPVVWAVTICAAVIAVATLLLREHPADMGLAPLGGARVEPAPAASTANPLLAAVNILVEVRHSRDFWLIAGTFFVCGLSTSGLVATHFIAYCFDNGIPETRGAGLLAFIGVFNVIGTTLSGWFTDRYDSRWLLFWYYGLRGISLLCLPFTSFDTMSLTIFAVFYGLDWIATVPPTVRLANDSFGKQKAPVIFGWLLAIHQIGGALAAFGAGFLRTALETYLQAFMISGFACLVAAVLALVISSAGRTPARPAPAAA